MAETEMQQDDNYDARFEFDAPRYYNFEKMSGGTPADKWFDTAPDGPGCKPERGAGTSREPFKQLQDNATNQQEDQQPHAAAEAAGAGGTDAQQTAEQKPKKPNIVTSWGQGAAGKAAGRKSSAPTAAAAAAAGGGGQGHADAPKAAEAGAGATSKPAAARRSLQGKVARRVSRDTGAVPDPSHSSQQQTARTEPPVTRSMSRLGLSMFSPVPENKATYGSPPRTRARTAGQRFYTEQKAKTAVARTKQPASVQKLHHVLAPKLKQSVRSTKALTLPNDFELATSKRCGGRPASAPAKSPFKPLAERVREFQCKTPTRFKSKPSAKPASNKKKSPITKAEAPRLLTSTRNRPRSCKSQQEIEQEELQHQFKARPVNSLVLSSSGQLGVPKVEKPQVTEPKPFNLRSDSRARVRCSHQHPSMQQAAAAAAGGQFKAHPLNRSILDGPTFKPHKEKTGLTKAVSPELRTKKRALTSTEAGHQGDRLHTRSHAEQQHGGHGAHAGSFKPTQPQPFRLQTEARGALHEHEMQAKLAADEARAKRLRRVTARPLPVTLDVPVVPAKPEPKPLTLPDPFPLKSVARHEEYEEQHRTKLQQEEEAARRAAEFKARPVAMAGPFVVHESDAPLTVPQDPDLATDSRAVERADFDAHMVDKMQQEEEQRRRKEELRRQQEEEAVREYRRKLRFSARPMPSFDQPFFAMPSDRALTKPKTPNFASKKLRKGG